VSSAVGNSSPFLNESPFQPIRHNGQPRIQVEILGQMTEMEIRPKNGASCRWLGELPKADVIAQFVFATFDTTLHLRIKSKRSIDYVL
jgi:hypothetical protein